METKKINKVLVFILVVLCLAFIGCFVYSFYDSNFSFVNTISSISSFFVAVLTVVYVYTTSKQMDYMKQQLNQMQNDHRMSEQPIVDFEELQFGIERPRLFYTPPEDKYSYLSRYHLGIKVRNVSSYPALFVDISAELIVHDKGDELGLGATSRRLNLVAANSVSEPVDIMFSGDNDSRIMSALRGYSTLDLPQIHIKACYKSLSGASYLLEHTYWLDIHEDNIDILKNWHTIIVSAPIEEKEILTFLQKTKTEIAQESAFDEAKERFDKKLLGENSINVSLIEIPQKFMLKAISDDEYSKEMDTHQYGRYIGKNVAFTECKPKVKS